MTTARQQCEALRADGQPCQATALPGRTHCYFHDPERAEQRAEGRRRGGQRRSKPATVLPAEVPDVPLGSVGDVVTLLGETINLTRRGQLDPKVSNAVGYLASVLVRALEGSEVERRLRALEDQLANRPGRKRIA